MSSFSRILNSFRGWPRLWLLSTALVALGFNTFFLLWLIEPAVSPSLVGVFYHWSGNPKILFFSIAVDMLGSWLILFLLLLLARIPGRTRVAIWTALLLFSPWFIYQNYCQLTYNSLSLRFSCILFFPAVIGTIFITVFWRPSFSRNFERIVSTATVVLIFESLFGVFLLGKLAVCGWQAELTLGSTPQHRQQTATAIEPHRIIWIVFDELSYRQVYGQRFPGLQLPAFDALSKQATVFTNVRPPGIYTEKVLPGLILGKTIDTIKTSDTEQLSVHDANTGKWQNFNQYDTVFQDALQSGYSTAIAGWYNPYCRLMPNVLDQCFWTFGNHLLNGMTSSASIGSNTRNALELFSCMAMTAVPSVFHRHYAECMEFFFPNETLPKSHIEDYKDLYAASQKLLRDRSAGFILLHLPVPHPGGIYDRATGRFTTAPTSTYLDNLALTDRCLAGFLSILKQTGQFNSSTIVIMGDHSWRVTQIWKPSIIWTAEDERASEGGKYDPRPVYVVKLAGQTAGTRIDTLYHAVNTRKLLDALFANQISTPAELSVWAQKVH